MTSEALLHALADRLGVATEFWDWKGQHIVVGTGTILKVLAEMGWEITDDESVRQAMHELDLKPWRRSLPPVVIVDRKSTRLNSSHQLISYAVFCLKKKS